MDKNIDKSKEVLTEYMKELASELKSKKNLPTQKVFKALQQQHLVGKILKEHDILNQRNILDDVDLLRACQLGIKGLDGYRENVADNLVTLLKNMNLKNYKNVVSPLGNYIIGFKTVKEYCPKFLRPNQLENAQKYYTEMKERINDVNESAIDMIIEDEYLPSIDKDFGIIERTKKGSAGFGETHLQDTIWNFGETQLVNIEDIDIVDVIERYQKQSGKSAIWKGAKSTPFLKFLKDYNIKHKVKLKKESIKLGLDEDKKEEIRIKEI